MEKSIILYYDILPYTWCCVFPHNNSLNYIKSPEWTFAHKNDWWILLSQDWRFSTVPIDWFWPRHLHSTRDSCKMCVIKVPILQSAGKYRPQLYQSYKYSIELFIAWTSANNVDRSLEHVGSWRLVKKTRKNSSNTVNLFTGQRGLTTNWVAGAVTWL